MLISELHFVTVIKHYINKEQSIYIKNYLNYHSIMNKFGERNSLCKKELKGLINYRLIKKKWGGSVKTVSFIFINEQKFLCGYFIYAAFSS